MKRNSKSVKIWQNYGHEFVASFLSTLYISAADCKHTALHEAVESQNVAKVQELLSRLDLVEINQ